MFKRFPTYGAVFQPHDAHTINLEAVRVEYCPVCGLPPDFCRLGPSWKACKPWCLKNYPHLYPELVTLSDDVGEGDVSSCSGGVTAAVPGRRVGGAKPSPSDKTRREGSPKVTVKRLARTSRKAVTSVGGLDGFGVKVEEAAKSLKKRFACGVCIVRGAAGGLDTIDLQGDFGEEVVDAILADFMTVTRESVVVLEEGNVKRRGKKKEVEQNNEDRFIK